MIFKEHTEPLEMLYKNLGYKILFRKTTELQVLRLKYKWKKDPVKKSCNKEAKGPKALAIQKGKNAVVILLALLIG